jgi:hypothetical protein
VIVDGDVAGLALLVRLIWPLSRRRKQSQSSEKPTPAEVPTPDVSPYANSSRFSKELQGSRGPVVFSTI